MYKSCTYCGSIHDTKVTCEMKPKRKKWEQDDNKIRTSIRKFRNSVAWTKKRDEIQERDLRLCQVCIRERYNTINKYTYEGTSVHHIYPLAGEGGWVRRLDNNCLITLCSIHHSNADNRVISTDELLEIVMEQEGKSTPPLKGI